MVQRIKRKYQNKQAAWNKRYRNRTKTEKRIYGTIYQIKRCVKLIDEFYHIYKNGDDTHPFVFVLYFGL